MMDINSKTVEILNEASLFWYLASDDDIESERQWLEAQSDCKLAVHDVTHPMHGGKRCTRIEWEVC
jgi:hypothetical protein